MLQLFWLVLVAGAAALIWALEAWLPYVVGGLVAGAAAIWVLVSTFWPSKPDRTCPKCRAAGLVKIRRGAPGVRCEECGFRDEALHVAYLDDW